MKTACKINSLSVVFIHASLWMFLGFYEKNPCFLLVSIICIAFFLIILKHK